MQDFGLRRWNPKGNVRCGNLPPHLRWNPPLSPIIPPRERPCMGFWAATTIPKQFNGTSNKFHCCSCTKHSNQGHNPIIDLAASPFGRLQRNAGNWQFAHPSELTSFTLCLGKVRDPSELTTPSPVGAGCSGLSLAHQGRACLGWYSAMKVRCRKKARRCSAPCEEERAWPSWGPRPGE
jgi:hypothetical protein